MSAPAGRDVPTLYDRLSLSPDATPAEITAAYRRLLRALHPDSAATNPDTGALQDVITAHRVLSDPAQRRAYDIHLGQAEAPRVSGHDPCPVCRGTRTIATPCTRCAGTGHQLNDAPWLRTAVRCPACLASGYRLTPCGACGASGRRS